MKFIGYTLLTIVILIGGFSLGFFYPYGSNSWKNKKFYEAIKPSYQEGQLAGKKPKNIIFMVGDGMGVTQVYAGMTANKGSLNLESFKCIGFSKTASSSSYITDSAAGATAFSIGKKTYNGAIGVDSDTVPHTTILEIAEQNGLATGLVATSQITHATPASFIAHQPSRQMYDEIASDFLKTDVDVFIGGGKDNFMNREDGQDLSVELKSKGYDVCTTIEEVTASKSDRIAGLLAPVGMPMYSEGRGDMLRLSAEKAIDILSKDEDGFFLLVEGSQIDWGGHKNDIDYVINEMLDFDRTIGSVLEWAANDGNTLVVVTADHETGGLTLTGGSLEDGSVDAMFTTGHHTSVMVPVFAFGPGAEAFMGIYDNHTIFEKFMSSYNFSEKEKVQ